MIINGPIADGPYRFEIKASPMTAALLRKDACTNAPVMLLSFIRNLAAAQIHQKQIDVATAQNSTYSASNTLRISTAEISRNTINGSVTVKLNLFAILIKLSLNIPLCRRNHPITITKKIGNVTLTLYIKFSSMISFHISGTGTLNQNKSAPHCLP